MCLLVVVVLLHPDYHVSRRWIQVRGQLGQVVAQTFSNGFKFVCLRVCFVHTDECGGSLVIYGYLLVTSL